MPRIEKSWTIGTLLAATTSVVTLLAVAVGIIWGYSHVAYASQAIPSIQEKQETNRLDIAVLKAEQRVERANSDQRYTEILGQLSQLNGKLDRMETEKQDKSTGGWRK